MSTLVIVPCGSKKVWDSNPTAGPTAARHAYVGTPFVVNRRYAEIRGDAWLVLSAKFGFIWPDFMINEPYDVTFAKKTTRPVTIEHLRKQVWQERLYEFSDVVGLGGKLYRLALKEAFSGCPCQLSFPFAGLPLGQALQATNRSTHVGE